ncbi:transcriptional regulator, MarR family [Polaromonas sp. OV174]|uniref:MarR family winged helix-turn-helix transcriptional regulator n=1 Tax=Polaromonas sp. OV174 TaxID=1855300 RepID=UPI0008E75DD8|nr:MarR family winged helix-turn-helix transcriptional regulator [Polaromonas sp. OV174]SFC41661.1 transcriptional regulator, MarR family [Polaromonas sp. OV174]
MFELDRTLTYRLHLLHKLSDIESQRAFVAGAGLSMSVARCLTAVGSFAPLSVNDLAQKANLDKGQASRAAQSLVDQGLVRKAASPTDGRGVVLTLTAAGDTAWRRAMQVVERRNHEIFGVLSNAEREQLSHLFDRVIAQCKAGGDGAAAQDE